MLIDSGNGAGTAYVYLVPPANLQSHKTQEFGGVYGTVNLDFDEDGNVVGVEVIS